MAEQEELGIPEAAALVRVSETTLRRMLQTGRVPSRKVKAGKRLRVLVRRADLLAVFGAGAAEGPGAYATKRRRSGTQEPPRPAELPPEASELVRVLQAELAKREHELEGLHQENADLRSELRQVNAEFRALLREGRAAAPEAAPPRGVAGFLSSLFGRG